MIRSVDQLHRELILLHGPQRIVSTVPSQTELLFYLGLGGRVAGITKFCVHPRNARNHSKLIGGTKNLWLDAIDDLRPDLILSNKEENDREQILQLSEKYPVWISDIKNISDAVEMIQSLGQLLGVEDNARHLAGEISRAWKNYEIDNGAGKRAAYFIWNDPLMVAGGDTFIDHMMRVAGFQNVFSNLKRYPVISVELLEGLAPEVLLLSSEPFPFKGKHIERFRRLCPQSVVILVDGTFFSWYGSRILFSFDYFRSLTQKI